MGLRCLLSHDFGEPELEREREEQGNEVVITVNEVKTCSRCGERRTISENTEVTSMEQLTATATDNGGAPDAGAPTQEPVGGSPQAEPTPATESTGTEDIGVTIDDSVTDDAEVLTDTSDDGDDNDSNGEPEDLGTATTANMTVDDVESAAAEQASAVEPDDDVASDDELDSAEDDGVILDADDEDDEEPVDREPGEWPEYESNDEGDGEAPWPDVEGDDEGYSAEEPAEEPEDMTFGGGFTPEITKSESGSVADAGEAVKAAGENPEFSFTRAEEASVEFEPTVDDIETEFYCPECGLARRSGNSSMRAGDICPDCKRGYISERQT